MLRHAKLIYCCFITGYMFRPTHRSSSGLLAEQSVNAIHVGIPSCSYDKIHKMFILEQQKCHSGAIEIL
jgi:hypothetical protein